MAQVSLIQKSIREVQVTSKTKIDTQTKVSLIEQLANKSFAESEVLVSRTLNIQAKEPTKTKHQKDDSVRLEVTFTKSQWEKLLKMRDFVSGSLPHGSGNWDQILEYAANFVIQYKDKITGKTCESKWRLTIDHIIPVWAGGSNEPENLRILCRAHNHGLYRQQAQISQR